jgi:hypothetical protein
LGSPRSHRKKPTGCADKTENGVKFPFKKNEDTTQK